MVGYGAGQRNMGMIVAALGAGVPPSTFLFFALAQFPIYLMPWILSSFAARIRRTRRLLTAPDVRPAKVAPLHRSCPMITLYSGPLSLFSWKVEIALREKGLRFERVMVPFNQTTGYDPKHPEVLALNPKGQVPVLSDAGLVLYDSTVIIEYLDEAYPEIPLYPGSPAERAQCRLDELFADEILLQA